MNIAVDVSPISFQSSSGHKVRGAGFYITQLVESLKKYDTKNTYTFFENAKEISSGSENYDVIHYPYFDPFFLTLPLFKKKKRVVTVHDLIPVVLSKYFPTGLKGRVKWSIQKQLLKVSDHIITDSEHSKYDIVRVLQLPKELVSVVPLAVNSLYKPLQMSKKKREEITEKYNLPDQFVLYVGDATWNKNLPRLVAAIKQINLTLVMVGKALAETEFDRENPWNADLVRVEKETEGDKRFIKLGFVPTEDLVYLYNMATVFVFPSLYEGFGFPVLEALSCGCPVVTTQNSSLPEIAGEAAHYVMADDTTSIANGIGEVYFSKKLQVSFSKKGITQAKKFSWEKTAHETVKVYELIGQSSK